MVGSGLGETRTPKTNFLPGPGRGHRRGGHVSVICNAAEETEAVTEKRGERGEGRRGEERYKLFESRVEAEGPEERSASAAVAQEDILSSEREKKRLGRMRGGRAGGRASAPLQRWNTKESYDDATPRRLGLSRAK